MKSTAIALIVLLAATGAVLADRDVSRTVSADPSGEVSIEILFGTVEVIGWSKAEVKIEGTVGNEVEDVEIDIDEDVISIEVDVDDIYEGRRGTSGNSLRADLVIHVPAGSFVEVEGINADVVVRDVEATVSVESVNGDVEISGTVREVEVETMASDVVFDGEVRNFEAESAAGSITVNGLNGNIDVETVAGNVRVTAIRLDGGDLSTVSGNIRLEGPLGGGGRLDIEAVSGNVELFLPSGSSADVYMSSFSGSIETDFGVQGRKEDRYSPEKSARFTVGSGGFQINIETFSGTCEVREM